MQALRICRHRINEHLRRVKRRLDWGQGFIFLVLQAALHFGSDVGSNGVESVRSGFVIKNR